MCSRCRLALRSALIVIVLVALFPNSSAAADEANPGDDPAIEGADRWIETGNNRVSQIVHSPQHDLLLLRHESWGVRIIDMATGVIIEERNAWVEIRDIAVSPDGNYFFVADGYASNNQPPSQPHYVHRYDIRAGQWRWNAAQGAATRIEAVSADRVLVSGFLGVVPVSLQSFSDVDNQMQTLSSVPTLRPGEFTYDPVNGRVYRGDRYRSEIEVMQLNGDALSFVERILIDEDLVFPGNVTLSADGAHVYYGLYEAETVTPDVPSRYYPEDILAATADWAIGETGALYEIGGDLVLDGPDGWHPSAASATRGTNDFFIAHPQTYEVLHCQTRGRMLSCPLLAPEDTACDGITPTIDMNTNGGDGTGTAGDDVILGTPGDDFINAGGGDDLICAGDGDDLVWAGPGHDQVLAQGGNDVVIGGPGNDGVLGGDGDDVLHGSTGDDNLSGERGADRMFGYAGDDTINGGPDDDRLHGNFGDDNIFGGDGNDRIFGYGDADLLYGNAGDDVMSGNFGDDLLFGGEGNDTIYGADGDDGIDGGDGNDRLFGNSLDDLIIGGPGNDQIDGGIGSDECWGGPDNDTFERCEAENQ